ncbi:MAG: hypothetical protein O3A00_02200 [Planctomycetota bacterium]|nr:hypothetical protein [Planctomycetota bacterium]
MKLIGSLLMVCVVLSSFQSASAHPFHAASADVEYNAKTHSLEVALRVDSGDLEEALRRMTKKKIDLDQTPDLDRLVQQLLAKSFRIKDAGNTDAKWNGHKWIGWELESRNAWIYFEVPLSSSVTTVTVQFQLLLEQVPRQVNMFSLTVNGKRRSMMFHREHPERVIELRTTTP